ncbi:hypothetical protein CALVIDRAFT_528843 [Calocera viscosa TUFC12733]|uniref:Uncharacterized protein n=1 Tax=Calocera viscosa (strain TUFC12733) TaxID=1330018 RepID=A0A167K7G3_CALVF|nr:hypothetical protein CALVIDRAFT_528843 [Calocera viscosa TUFC12733]
MTFTRKRTLQHSGGDQEERIVCFVLECHMLILIKIANVRTEVHEWGRLHVLKYKQHRIAEVEDMDAALLALDQAAERMVLDPTEESPKLYSYGPKKQGKTVETQACGQRKEKLADEGETVERGNKLNMSENMPAHVHPSEACGTQTDTENWMEFVAKYEAEHPRNTVERSGTQTDQGLPIVHDRESEANWMEFVAEYEADHPMNTVEAVAKPSTGCMTEAECYTAHKNAQELDGGHTSTTEKSSKTKHGDHRKQSKHGGEGQTTIINPAKDSAWAAGNRYAILRVHSTSSET